MATQLKTKWIQDNAITSVKIDATAVTAAKLALDVYGNGLDATAGTPLKVLADGTSLTVGALGVRITAGGIDAAMLANGSVTATKISSSIAGDGLAGGDGTALSVNVDGITIETNADALRVKNAGISTSKILDRAVTIQKLDDVAGDGLTGADGTNNIAVLADGTSLTVSGFGVKITTSGVDADMLAGSIPDSKLLQLTTTNKVAATAVEDRFIRNDSDDTSSGRIQANGFDANNNRISRVSDATSNNDAVNLGQVNSIVTAGRLWKETLLYSGQLFDGTAGGISGANVVVLPTSDFATGSIIHISDSTFTEDYTAVTGAPGPLQFQVGVSINDTLTSLGSVINGGPVALSATTHLLDTIDSTHNVLILYGDYVGQQHRLWGDVTASLTGYILSTNKLYEGVASDLTSIPTVDPVTTNFGFSRLETALVTAETHYLRENDAAYTWDASALKWNQSGATGVPYATKTDYGKVRISDGIAVSSGIISVQADATTLSVGVNGVKVASGGISSQELATDSVISAKIIANAVTETKIASDAVTTGKILDRNVTVAKIGTVVDSTGGLSGLDGTSLLGILLDSTSLSVGGSGLKIADSGVTTGKIASGAVTFSRLQTDATSGLQSDGPNDGIKVKLKAGGGIFVDSTGLYVSAQAQVASFYVENHVLTSGEVSAKAFTLQATPTDSTKVELTILGGVQQSYGVDYAVTGTTLSWTGLGLEGFVLADETAYVTYPVLA